VLCVHRVLHCYRIPAVRLRPLATELLDEQRKARQSIGIHAQ
jgi:hypothetical protein